MSVVTLVNEPELTWTNNVFLIINVKKINKYCKECIAHCSLTKLN